MQTLSFRHILGAALLTGMTLTACSGEADDTALAEPVPQDVTQCFDAMGKAWLHVQVSMGESTTRATNDTFTPGTADENKVGSATLVLFHGAVGTAEDELTVASVYPYVTTYDDASDGQLSRQSVATTVQLTNAHLQAGDELSLLVLLNVRTTPILAGTRFGDLKRRVLTDIGNADLGFAMANVPAASMPGGSNDPASGNLATLVKVPTASIRYTESEAAALAPVCICVERAAAKVTVADDIATKKVGSTELTFAESDLQFAVDNYNTTCFLTRQFSNRDWLSYEASVGGHRFVASAPYYADAACYRTYWAEDANYGADATALVHADGAADVAWTAIGEGHPQYCAENTTDVAHMTVRNTTSVLVRLQLNDGEGFYTCSDTGDKIYTEGEKDAWLAEHPESVAAFYEHGYCYYRIPLEHFGREMTPWTFDPATMSDGTAAAYYSGNAGAYLGRYGVVRNNHYVVVLDAIKHIGSNVLPPLSDKAADTLTQ